MGSSRLQTGFGKVAFRIVLYCLVGAVMAGILVTKAAAARSAEASGTSSASTPVAYRAPVRAGIATDSRPTPPSTAVAPAPTTVVTEPPPPPTTQPAPPTTAPHVAIQTARSTSASGTGQPTGYGCGPAISYLQANSAPGFQFECPGYAQGHQAMTCIDVAGVCPGIRLIVIHVPCAAAYENEAHNSWVLAGLRQGSIDPYGYCH